jgi:transglutaminase-like putative cysteine protease
MNNKPYCSPLRRRSRISRFAARLAAAPPLLAAVLLFGAPALHANSPDWLRAAAQQQLPEYPKDTKAVILYDERVTTVKNSGEIETLYRRAYRILRPQGREYGLVIIHFDKDTQIKSLKAWSIPANGKEFEVKDKDAIETGFTEDFYSDDRQKLIQIPAADPGNVIGYEYVQKRRPYVLQDAWWFQEDIPIRQARFTLQLPPGWEFNSYWANYASRGPQSSGQNVFAWQLENVPAVHIEPHMPPWQTVAGRLAVNFFPPGPRESAKSPGSWSDVGIWEDRLTDQSRVTSPGLKLKAAELTANAASPLDKMNALATFMQHEIRYVAIEIGIGGFQPHLASDVFTHRYGDCKDKATLLSTLLREAGIDSYFVLIHTKRGIVLPDVPSALTFNHAILAIRLPGTVNDNSLYAVMNHPRLGRLLFFDPTNTFVPLGYLPTYEQENYALVVTPEGGELVKLPLSPPATNRLLRSAKLFLTPTGTLSGEVQEIRWGAPAAEQRAELINASASDRRKVIETFLGSFLPGFVLTGATVGNLDKIDDTLTLDYRFVVDNYAKQVGNLLVLRPRVLGAKASEIPDLQERKYPVEFSSASLQSDFFEITIPPGYVADDLPSPVHAVSDFAEYSSHVEVVGNVLRYSRTYEVKNVIVPAQKLDELRKFYGQVAADERSSAVLRRANP